MDEGGGEGDGVVDGHAQRLPHSHAASRHGTDTEEQRRKAASRIEARTSDSEDAL